MTSRKKTKIHVAFIHVAFNKIYVAWKCFSVEQEESRTKTAFFTIFYSFRAIERYVEKPLSSDVRPSTTFVEVSRGPPPNRLPTVRRLVIKLKGRNRVQNEKDQTKWCGPD